METKIHHIRSTEQRDEQHPTYVREHIRIIGVGKDRAEKKEVQYPPRWQKARGK